MAPNEFHRKVVEFVHRHPILEKVLSDDLLAQLRQSSGKRGAQFPEIYCCIAEGDRMDLRILETGLDFVLRNTRRGKRNNLICALRDTRNVGATFELAVIGSLVSEFEEAAVIPYPELGNGKQADVSVRAEGTVFYIEVSVLNFSKDLYDAYEEAKAKGKDVFAYVEHISPQARLIQKVEEKFQRHAAGKPNILVVSRYDWGGDDQTNEQREDLEVLESYLGQRGGDQPARNFAGLFHLDSLRKPKWVPNRACDPACVVPATMVESLKRALRRMAPTPFQ